MGSLVSLLVLGAVYSIVYVVKNLGGNDGGKVFGEGFPTVEMLEPEQEQDTVPPVPPVVVPVRAAEKHLQRKKDALRAAHSIVPPAADDKTGEPVKKERLARLGSKSEAKRAFLYSEIFNRKY